MDHMNPAFAHPLLPCLSPMMAISLRKAGAAVTLVMPAFSSSSDVAFMPLKRLRDWMEYTCGSS